MSGKWKADILKPHLKWRLNREALVSIQRVQRESSCSQQSTFLLLTRRLTGSPTLASVSGTEPVLWNFRAAVTKSLRRKSSEAWF